LFPGHEIQSGESGFAVVRYPDATRLELGSDSTLRLLPIAAAPGKKVLLTQGVVTADVTRQPDGRPLVLDTPFAELSGPAAHFLAAITADATRVELDDGQLQMSPMNAGPPVQLAAGSYIVAGVGATTAPRPLPMRLTEDKATIRIGKYLQAASFSEDGSLFASAVGDGMVKLWDVELQRPRTSLALPVLGASVLAFSADGKMLAAACPDKPARQVRVVVWDLASGEQRAGFLGLPDVSALAFAPDGRRLAVGGSDGKHAPDVMLWNLDADSREMLPPQAIPPDARWRGAASLAFSPEGDLLAVGGRDGVVRLIDLVGGKPMILLHGHTDAAACVAFSPDGSTLASGGRGKDRTLRLWDVATGQEGAVAASPSGAVLSVCFSPDGQTVAAGCDGGVGRLWDAASGMEIATVPGHKRPICGVAFSADGQTLMTAGREGIVKFWLVTEAEEIN
jgi:WD40 repeat protein